MKRREETKANSNYASANSQYLQKEKEYQIKENEFKELKQRFVELIGSDATLPYAKKGQPAKAVLVLVPFCVELISQKDCHTVLQWHRHSAE